MKRAKRGSQRWSNATTRPGGAVDTFDRMCHSLWTKRKTRRWPMPVYFNMFDTIGITAFIVCKEFYVLGKFNGNRKRSHFLECLAEELISGHLTRRLAQPKKPNTSLEQAIQHVCFQRKINRPTTSDRPQEATPNGEKSEKRSATTGNIWIVRERRTEK